MRKKSYKSVAAIVGVSLAFLLAGCAAPSAMTMTDSLQKLEDAGAPCLYPLFNGFDGLVKSDQEMFCRDQDGGSTGYKVAFFTDQNALAEALIPVCTKLTGEVGPSESLAIEVLKGDNWILTSDIGSKYSIDELEATLGGSKSTMSKICQ